MTHENITFTEEISKYNEDLINKCIETSEIKELIENLPLGLNTQVVSAVQVYHQVKSKESILQELYIESQKF